ncbi:hypothetical protein [Listeria innocua]|uniref:hypothetical protein n=1 Tax=Listeria innocua TaxID=1642 RepID=UPI0016276C84|nr:hypothetical protein [Listeria innocua]MBC2156713.1 hypothetical protein [Listeria innocua]
MENKILRAQKERKCFFTLSKNLLLRAENENKFHFKPKKDFFMKNKKSFPL